VTFSIIPKFVGLSKEGCTIISVTLRRVIILLVDNEQLVSHSEDASWVYDLAFLTDIFGYFNGLNGKVKRTF
jgi:hypothetical protein